MRTRQGQECVHLIQKGSHFRVGQSGPDDNVPKRMTHKTAETKKKRNKKFRVVKKNLLIQSYFCKRSFAMWEKQILARAVGIQNGKLGVATLFSEIMKQQCMDCF